ncbi:MAG TPA: hypothetical protein VH253_16855 [Phycisphaerae bacterium]|nr:hypothetical protein [Phycisphaerae bacterium]
MRERWRSLRGIVAAVVLQVLATAFSTTPAMASLPDPSAPLADRVPAGTLAYLGWAGAQPLADAYAHSNLKGFLDASSLPAFFAGLPDALQRASPNPDTAAQLQFAASVLGPLWRHPTALFLSAAPPNEAGPPVRIGILCDAGPEAPALARLLDRFAQSLPDSPLKPTVAAEAHAVAIAFGFPAAGLLHTPPQSLARDPHFAQALHLPAPAASAAPPTPALAAYIDIHGLLAALNQYLAAHNLAGAQHSFNALYAATGLADISQLGFQAGFDGKNWLQFTNLGLSAPRPLPGLLRLAAPPPFDAQTIRLIPNDALDADLRALDLPGLLDDLQAALPKIDPSLPAQYASLLQAFRQRAGVDLEKDLLASIGNALITYRSPLPDGAPPPLVVILKIRDPQHFAPALATLERRFPNPGPFRFAKVMLPGAQVKTVRMGDLEIGYALWQDNLLLTKVRRLPAVLRQLQLQSQATPTGTLAGNPIFAALRKPFPDELFSLGYLDARRDYPDIAAAAHDLLPTAGAMIHLKVPPGLLPSADAATPFLSPGISAAWTDQQGAHWVLRCAFPGAQLMASRQLAASTLIAGLASAFVGPSLSQSAEAARRSADAANARSIATACILYANQHMDQFPDSLAPLLASGDLPPKALLLTGSSTPPLTPDQITAMAPAALSAALAGHCDFVYLGTGMPSTSDNNMVLLYERPRPTTPTGILVAFYDGHVELVPWMALKDKFQPLNDFRRAQGQQPIDTEALIPVAARPTVPPGG